MSKLIRVLAMVAALGAAMPALAQSGERDATYSAGSSFGGFQYRPFRVQVEGGPIFARGAESRNLDSGSNIGLGFTWQPTAHLPLALRVDGMYAHFDNRPPLNAQGAATLGTTVDWGDTQMWGGDADAELDTLLGPRVRLYFLAGGGFYDRRTRFYQYGIANGVFCGWYFCFAGPVLASFRVGQMSTGMRFAENAGAGLELSLGGDASFFVDARYMRFNQSGRNVDFIPVRIGLRF